MCLYSCLSYPACKLHNFRAIVICGLSGYNIFFSHRLINGKILEKLLFRTNSVFRVLLQLLYETFPIYLLIYFILFYFILFYSILFYFILFYFILFYSILFYSILFYFILFYSILFYFILFYSILFYSILFYFILFYFISIYPI